MKKIIRILSFVLLIFLSSNINAQTDYNYTLIDNGNYSFSIGLVPETTTSNFQTSVQSYGFTILLPAGVTGSITSSLGGAAGATFFNGSAVGQPTNDGYLITETLGSPVNIAAPSDATTTVVVTFQVSGSPTSGEISVLANNSSLAMSVPPLVSFLQADTIDNGTAEYSNRINSATGLSGTSSVPFNTLSVNSQELAKVSVYPNPVKDILTIKGLKNRLDQVEVFSVSGKRIIIQASSLETINVSKLHDGVYFLKLKKGGLEKIIKFIKN